MLKEIYRKIIKNQHDTIEREGIVDDLIDQVTKPYKDRLSDRDMETFKDLLSAVALAGEEVGFQIGARFSIKLLRELTD